MREGTEGTGSQRGNGGTETNDSPIGIFDSGVGGLSLLAEIRRQLPHEDIIYVADSAHAPYGSQTPAFIAERSLGIARWLVSHGAKAILVACNTATTVAVRRIREHVTVPVVAIEPAVKPAAESSRTGVIGVLATAATLGSESFERLAAAYPGVRVIGRACEGLVDEIERGNLEGPEVQRILTAALAPIVEAGADAVVLGCTHYPLVRPLIERLAGPAVTVIDPADAVVRQVRRRLGEEGLLTARQEPGTVAFLTSGPPESLRALLTRLWGDASSVDTLRES